MAIWHSLKNKEKITFLVDGQIYDGSADVQFPKTLSVDETTHNSTDKNEINLVLVSDQEMLRCNSLQIYDRRSWLVRIERNWLYRHLGAAPLKRWFLRSSGICCGLGRPPVDEGLDSAYEDVFILSFFLFNFEIDLAGFELHECDVTELMNIVHWRGFFKFHVSL